MALDVHALLAAIDSELGSAVSRSAQNSRAIDDLYEAFLLGLVLAAARRIDANAVAWSNLGGTRGASVRLRASPGEIYSSNFSFATLSFGGVPVFEVHLGVRVVGMSGVAHECDVAVFHVGQASRRRAARQKPAFDDLFFAVEAKAYEATRVDLGLARGYVGLRADLHQRKLALVSSIDIDASAQQLAASWTAGAFERVEPNSPEADRLELFFAAVLNG